MSSPRIKAKKYFILLDRGVKHENVIVYYADIVEYHEN